MRSSAIYSNIMLVAVMLFAWSCDVHEWPSPSDSVPLHISLDCQTDMIQWHHSYHKGRVSEVGVDDTMPSERNSGEIRYIVRAFATENRRAANSEAVAEFVFTKDMANGYHHEATISLPPGNYNLAIWSDMTASREDSRYYNADDFSFISLAGDHRSCDDYRDAFCGRASVSLVADIYDRNPDTLDITLMRPLAKFEFVTSDIAEFTEKLIKGANATRTINSEDYEVRLYYVGYAPTSYNLFTDSPANAITNLFFTSSLALLNEREASLGFDYIFTYDYDTKIAVQVGVYNQQGKQLSLSEVVNVPLRRSHHTIIRGDFLFSDASGGVTIDPGFNGDHNIVIPQ